MAVPAKNMSKDTFWKRFEAAYPKDQELLKEILPAEKIESLIQYRNDYALYSWFASFFRDAIEYGRKSPKE